MKQLVLRALIGAMIAIPIAPFAPFAPVSAADVAPAAKAASQSMSEGSVRRLDRAAGSITISHGPIENLGMGAMTMTFTFKKGVVPASLKEGDKLRFRAEEKAGQYIVVRVLPAK